GAGRGARSRFAHPRPDGIRAHPAGSERGRARDSPPVPERRESDAGARVEAALHAGRGARADHRLVQGVPRRAGDGGAAAVTCRSCGGESLAPVLSLGATPLANALVAPSRLADPEARFPLDLVRCPVCTLLQITVTVPPEAMFLEYPYFSSYSD